MGSKQTGISLALADPLRGQDSQPLPHDAVRKGDDGDSRVLGVLSQRLTATAAAANGNRQRAATAKDALTSRANSGYLRIIGGSQRAIMHDAIQDRRAISVLVNMALLVGFELGNLCWRLRCAGRRCLRLQAARALRYSQNPACRGRESSMSGTACLCRPCIHWRHIGHDSGPGAGPAAPSGHGACSP